MIRVIKEIRRKFIVYENNFSFYFLFMLSTFIQFTGSNYIYKVDKYLYLSQ